MDLDKAFKIAVKKFYAQESHKNVDKYSKNPFEYTFENLDSAHKKFAKSSSSEDTQSEEVLPEEPTEVTPDSEISEGE